MTDGSSHNEGLLVLFIKNELAVHWESNARILCLVHTGRWQRKEPVGELGPRAEHQLQIAEDADVVVVHVLGLTPLLAVVDRGVVEQREEQVHEVEAEHRSAYARRTEEHRYDLQAKERTLPLSNGTTHHDCSTHLKTRREESELAEEEKRGGLVNAVR